MDLPITTEIITIIILNNTILPQVTLHAVTAASKLGGEVTCLVAGPAGVQGVAKEAATVAGVSKVRVASLYCTVLTVLYCTVLYCTVLTRLRRGT